MITLNASDPDLGLNGEIKYSLEPSDSSEDFKLNSQTGLLSVASELDRETKEFYDLTIKAEDHAGPINGQLPLGTIHMLRKHFYSTKINLTSKLFTKTVFFVKTEEFLFQHYILTKFSRCSLTFLVHKLKEKCSKNS